jgi:O-antigen ligase
VAVFFFNGPLGTALAVISFLAAWTLMMRDTRGTEIPMPPTALILIVFFVGISIRLMLPPSGTQTIPGVAATRALLLLGLYGLACYVYPRVPFARLLLLIAVVVVFVTALSLVVHVAAGSGERLAFLGRASHPIFGAGATAVGTLATATLIAGYHRILSASAIAGLAAMLVTILVGIMLTASRGPMLALTLAALLTPIVVYTRSGVLAVGVGVLSWAVVTSSVIFEAPIKELFCPWTDLACRPSLRHDVWVASIAGIAQHPLWGYGYGFRFEGIPHAHNAYLGMALHYGVPLCLIFIVLMATALDKAARLSSTPERIFVVGSLIFSNGFMGSDLSDPMRFFNTHYLFLWFPLFLAFIGKSPRRRRHAAQNARRKKARAVRRLFVQDSGK